MIIERANGLFAIYVHWPFCASKCPYCDFNSHVRRGPFNEVEFVGAYLDELSHFAALSKGKKVGSIFFGGGTPSLMEPRSVGAIIEKIDELWPVDQNVEITLEANPTSVEANRFKSYRQAGVNRVSLGVQSLRDEPLARLGRLHSVGEAKLAVGIAQSIFERSSFDLIYARPHQSLAEWEAELNEALNMAVGHLSLYQLTIEKGTRYYDLRAAGKLAMPSSDLSADFYQLTQEICNAAGLPAYEISNHARPGEESVHNLTYWRYGEYIGVGAGAHGRLLINDERHALASEKQPQKWAKLVAKTGSGLVVDDRLTWEEEADEYLVMGMRLKEGISLERYHQLSGRQLNPVQISELLDIGFVQRLENGNLRVSDKGWPVLDAVVADLAM
ncbi:Radical SAM family enzyme, similar to coproporphyrinogen III oxidase, oxygen-independent, clustered with nucleoside-triphosphatase RdgB [hydrothermal vent metagenome]|uniref:Radical SAM family enzyme, similar to coproporphyrinogen III oxidase, oxygen-independent, clustered with nucleoside-triphosphatase RdgB n=1 Tax=hydrothermal vent metagenome TaxID=652676 RepID=A0A3B0ULN4_9ZZZZ